MSHSIRLSPQRAETPPSACPDTDMPAFFSVMIPILPRILKFPPTSRAIRWPRWMKLSVPADQYGRLIEPRLPATFIDSPALPAASSMNSSRLASSLWNSSGSFALPFGSKPLALIIMVRPPPRVPADRTVSTVPSNTSDTPVVSKPNRMVIGSPIPGMAIWPSASSSVIDAVSDVVPSLSLTVRLSNTWLKALLTSLPPTRI